MRVDRGVVVEESRDEGEEDADALVGRGGDGEELLEDLGLLRPVGVLGRMRWLVECGGEGREKRAHLASTSLENLGERLEDALGRDGDDLLDADSLEAFFLGIDDERSLLLASLGCGRRGVLRHRFPLESLGILRAQTTVRSAP